MIDRIYYVSQGPGWLATYKNDMTQAAGSLHVHGKEGHDRKNAHEIEVAKNYAVTCAKNRHDCA